MKTYETVAALWGRRPRLATRLLLSMLAVALFPFVSSTHALYILEGNINTTEMFSGDVFVVDATQELIARRDGDALTLHVGQTVHIFYGDEVISTIAHQETLEKLFARLGFQISPLEMVSVSFVDGGVDITVGSEFVFYAHRTTPVAYETIYRDNDQMYTTEEHVLQAGRNGSYSEVYEIIYQDGEETARQLIETAQTDPVSAIVERGTIDKEAEERAAAEKAAAEKAAAEKAAAEAVEKAAQTASKQQSILDYSASNSANLSSIVTNPDGSGTITLESGEVVTFSSSRSMTATAYTTGGKVGTITASGTTVHVGVVAVDRKIMPLGTKVYVTTNDGSYVYGFAVAEDTGVRGNIIDLYMNTYDECIQFGVRDCTVYILD